MIKVYYNYEWDLKSLFLAVRIIDEALPVFVKKHDILSSNELHNLGITAILIASKKEDTKHISIKTIHEKLGFCKFS